MPHNNRMSTSGALKMTGIWSQTIGYDPYAAEGEEEKKQAETALRAERNKGIMDLARESNVDGADRGAHFAQSVFWGLKRKGPPKGYELPMVESEEEDLEAPIKDEDASSHEKKKKKKKKKHRHHHKRRRREEEKEED